MTNAGEGPHATTIEVADDAPPERTQRVGDVWEATRLAFVTALFQSPSSLVTVAQQCRHPALLAWSVFVLPATDDFTAPLQALRVSVLASAPTAQTRSIVAEFRREALAIDELSMGALDVPPTAPVYVISVVPAQIADLGPRCVMWASTGQLRAGLIGVIEDGTPDHVEELLATGFDDVVTTPASARELVARVRAVHRRVFWKGLSNGRLRFADLTLDLYGRELWIDGKTVLLTSIELAVLRELMKARGKPLSRAELLDLAWGEGDLEVSERAVDNVILRLRRKLPSADIIETVRSVGFRISDR